MNLKFFQYLEKWFPFYGIKKALVIFLFDFPSYVHATVSLTFFSTTIVILDLRQRPLLLREKYFAERSITSSQKNYTEKKTEKN